MKTRFLSLAAVAALLLVPALASAASLSVTGAAALEGAFGMNLNFNGNATQTFVQDNTPDSEPTYNFEFRLRFNDIAANLNATQPYMLVRSDTPTNEFRVFLWCRTDDCGPAAGDDGQVALEFQARKDVGPPPWKHCALIGAGPGANVLWRVELVKGSGSDDGTCRVFRNGVMLVERFDMPDNVDFDAHRWGALAAVNTSFIGNLHNDSFVSTR